MASSPANSLRRASPSQGIPHHTHIRLACRVTTWLSAAPATTEASPSVRAVGQHCQAQVSQRNRPVPPPFPFLLLRPPWASVSLLVHGGHTVRDSCDWGCRTCCSDLARACGRSTTHEPAKGWSNPPGRAAAAKSSATSVQRRYGAKRPIARPPSPQPPVSARCKNPSFGLVNDQIHHPPHRAKKTAKRTKREQPPLSILHLLALEQLLLLPPSYTTAPRQLHAPRAPSTAAPPDDLPLLTVRATRDVRGRAGFLTCNCPPPVLDRAAAKVRTTAPASHPPPIHASSSSISRPTNWSFSRASA